MRSKISYRSEVLPYAIQVFQEAGYNLVTVAECLGEEPYLRIDAPSARDVCLSIFLTF